MNKTIFFFFLNVYSLLVFSSYSTPILLLPALAKQRSLDSVFVALIFMAFPVGAFPASLLIGKLMRFYKKDKLLLIFNTIASLARFSIGLLYYIEDPKAFFIVAVLARFFTGVAEGSLIPITYSFIPDLFPEEMMVKLGILEIWGSVGTILGAPLSSLIYEQFGYFAVFAIMSTANLFLGMFIIIFFFGSESLVRFKKTEKQFLPIKDALFKNKAVLLNFFYLFIFFFPNFMILTGYQNYLSTLTSSLTVSAVIYSLILVGMILGVFWIKYLYKKKFEKMMLAVFGLSIILALTFYGPDPFFGITDNNTKMVLIGLSFLVAGTAMEVIFLIITKLMITELLEVFPGDNELCADFANGMYTACFTLDQFFAPMTGSILNTYLGYSRTGTCYAIIAFVNFLLYWSFIKKKNGNYDNMAEEEENGQN